MASVQQLDGQGAEPTTEVSEDELFDVLANQRRRFAVHLLKREEADKLEIGDMAEQIAAWENGIDTAEITGNERKRVYTALQQSHLPKMDDAGVVEFNKDRGIVEPTPALQNVDLYMDVVEGKEIPWSDYYLGLSGVAAALTGAVWLDAWPFVLLPDMAWAVAIVVAFAFSAVVHKYYTAEMRVGEPGEPPELR
ncbi:hypothetical protein DVK05_01500 [Halorubrum sp. Atlit-8R]|uniref:DUF7344 domain-containing protein n=1 Tax=unclassified Halorubrum TaxID=2642239 RepID=UPI000EF1D880|nr:MULTISPECIES: hypothetical protein [unclassified Halorubrum]RLM71363.1 hypothetical protein DVK08_04265 [Halorubrum sp. Atlit-9R]RLM82485.1 hypothetical protein DVK05_01500 [Halorubrum sp. Atlit-8R]